MEAVISMNKKIDIAGIIHILFLVFVGLMQYISHHILKPLVNFLGNALIFSVIFVSLIIKYSTGFMLVCFAFILLVFGIFFC